MSSYPLRIVFEFLDVNLVGVDVHIYLEDISEAGAPSKIVAERSFANVSIPCSESVYLANLDVPSFGRGAQISVRVHVDTSRSGTTTVGDYLSTSVCPIPEPVPAEGIDVHVHRI